jgi:Zn-dependent protease
MTVTWVRLRRYFKRLRKEANFGGLGFGVKIVALFFLGGLVSFLQKSETEIWKCFLIGISAPALVTTATARADTTTLTSLARQVPVISLDYFAETPWQQFSRGLVGSDPGTTLVILGQTSNASAAQAVSAAGWLEFTCSPSL